MEGGTGSPDVRLVPESSYLGTWCSWRRAGQVGEQWREGGRGPRHTWRCGTWQKWQGRTPASGDGGGDEMVCRVGCVNNQFERLELRGAQSC